MQFKILVCLFSFFCVLACTQSAPNNVVHSDVKSDTNTQEQLKSETTSLGFKRFNVFDIEQNLWIDKPWEISDDAFEIRGYKNYNSLYAYMVIGWLHFYPTDTVNHNCWALTIGTQDKNLRHIPKECYIVLDYQKHLKKSPYSPNNSEHKSDTFSMTSFIPSDTMLLYKFANEKSIFCKENELSTAIDFSGEYLTPCQQDTFFLLGKPKYKLVLK